MSCAEIFGETSNHPGDSAPLPPRLGALQFWLFPKLKSPLKGERFQTTNEIQENMMGQLTVIGRTVFGPKVPTLKGTEVSLSYAQCFLYLVSSSINVSFILHGWIPSGQTSHIYKIYKWINNTYIMSNKFSLHIHVNINEYIVFLCINVIVY